MQLFLFYLLPLNHIFTLILLLMDNLLGIKIKNHETRISDRNTMFFDILACIPLPHGEGEREGEGEGVERLNQPSTKTAGMAP